MDEKQKDLLKDLIQEHLDVIEDLSEKEHTKDPSKLKIKFHPNIAYDLLGILTTPKEEIDQEDLISIQTLKEYILQAYSSNKPLKFYSEGYLSDDYVSVDKLLEFSDDCDNEFLERMGWIIEGKLAHFNSTWTDVRAYFSEEYQPWICAIFTSLYIKNNTEYLENLKKMDDSINIDGEKISENEREVIVNGDYLSKDLVKLAIKKWLSLYLPEASSIKIEIVKHPHE